LSNGAITIDEHDEKYYRQYLGGRGIVADYLYREIVLFKSKPTPQKGDVVK
jgi:hypothetical protein